MIYCRICNRGMLWNFLAVRYCTSGMPVIGPFAGLLPGRFGRYHHQPAIPHPAFGDDMVGEMLELGAAALQRRHLHAVVVVEMNVQRGHREIVMTMVIL